MSLGPKKYLDIIKHTTLTSVDLIIIYKDEILLGLRNNSPAKNFWFVPGCRTFKNETQDEGIKRVAKLELGIELNDKRAQLLGVFDHIYSDNFKNSDFGTHYVVSAYLIILDTKPDFQKDQQHESLKFFNINELKTNEKIHKYTQNYYDFILKIMGKI